jgi:N-acetylmuramoyl-L-alanine amidase
MKLHASRITFWEGRRGRTVLRAARWCLAASLLAGAASPAPAAAPLTVKAVRHYTASDYTRIVLDMTGEPRYRVHALSNPYRVVIEIPSGKVSKKVQPISIGDGVVERIRFAQSGSEADVIIDLPGPMPYKHFVLEPYQGKPHRIVIDLGLPGAPAPSGEEASGKEPADTGGQGARQGASARTGAGTPALEPKKEIVVAIDPGHGGAATGAMRGKLMEKTLNLKLARMLKAELERHQGFRAILVRQGDYDVEWYRRVTFARDHGGDAFVSLHFNSNKNPRVRGIEIYFLSLEGASDENAEAVAEQENLLLDAGDEAQAFNDDLKSILFDATRANAVRQSSLLAEEVASELQSDSPVPFHKVAQANFIVLRGISMPSILVEGPYLTNRDDAAIAQKDGFLRWFAKGLADGIVGYFSKYPPAAPPDGGQR